MNIPRPPSEKTQRKESDVTRELVQALERLPGVKAWRCNSGKVRVRGGFMTLAPPGTPDVIGFLSPKGRFFGIELKASHKDNCSCRECEGQRLWALAANAMGALYLKTRSVEEAVNWLTAMVVL